MVTSRIPSGLGKADNRYQQVWFKDGDNLVVVKFEKKQAAAIQEKFAKSTNGSSVIDPDLVAALKELNVNDGLTLPKGQTSSERAFKVRVNKAAKMANRRLDWAEDATEYTVRVAEILQPTANGTTPAPAAPAPAQEAVKK